MHSFGLINRLQIMHDALENTHNDESSFKHLFVEYYRPLTAFAFKLIKDQDVAKDVVQNIFVRFFKNSSVHIQGNVKHYLYRAVHNECLNEIKKASIRKKYHDQHSIFQDFSYIEQAIEQSEREQEIAKAIEKLPSKCRQIFLMSRFDEKKNTEIAQELNLSIRTVETQISLALKSLRKDLLAVFYFLLPGIF